MEPVWEGVSRMNIWLVSDGGVEQRRVEELQVLLQRKDRLVWVDIPECDEQPSRR
jgi:magnesium transporter